MPEEMNQKFEAKKEHMILPRSLDGLFDSNNSKIKYKSGAVYEGDIKNGRPNGYGRYTWADGDYYEGEFADGNFNG